MSEIPILDDMPVILTKDADWVNRQHRAEPGSIVLLPEDAVLAVPRETVQIKMAPIDLGLEDQDE